MKFSCIIEHFVITNKCRGGVMVLQFSFRYVALSFHHVVQFQDCCANTQIAVSIPRDQRECFTFSLFWQIWDTRYKWFRKNEKSSADNSILSFQRSTVTARSRSRSRSQSGYCCARLVIRANALSIIRLWVSSCLGDWCDCYIYEERRYRYDGFFLC